MASMKLLSKSGLHAWFVSDGYVWDWLACAVLIIVSYLVPTYSLKPVTRYYETTDATLQYPANASTISSPILYVITFLFPGIVIIACALYRRSFHDG